MTNKEIADKRVLNDLSGRIIRAAIKVHSNLGPGLLESAYEACLKQELLNDQLSLKSQAILAFEYENMVIEKGYRVDLMVESAVIVEIKAVDILRPAHRAQLLSYLRLSGLKLGLLINFNELYLKDGIKRIVNNFPD